jgi:hypothetical protein
MQEAKNTLSNLARLARGFQSQDPGQATAFKFGFKSLSKNDNARIGTYLLEVVAVKDAQCKQLQDEVSDLRELLKFNKIEVTEEAILAAKKALDAVAEAPQAEEAPAANVNDVQPVQDVVAPA